MKSNLDSKALKPIYKKLRRIIASHGVFTVIMLVLITYLLIVLRISQYANAEPSNQSTADVSTKIPKIDKSAVTQIQALENNSPAVHSLFNDARNNPFQE